MVEQQQLLDEMLSRAEVCVEDLHRRIEESTASDEASKVALQVTAFKAMLSLGVRFLGLILGAYAAGLAEASEKRRPSAYRYRKLLQPL